MFFLKITLSKVYLQSVLTTYLQIILSQFLDMFLVFFSIVNLFEFIIYSF